MSDLMQSLLQHAVIETIGRVLLHFVWQGAIVAGAAAVLLRLFAHHRAETRYAIACGALAAMLLLPLATFTLLSVEPHGPLGTTAAQGGIPPVAAASGAMPAAGVWETWTEAALPFVVALWAAGVAFLSIRLVSGLLSVERLARRTTELPAGVIAAANRLSQRLGIDRGVRFLRSASVDVPTVVGWLRPAVLVPASAITGLTPEQLETLLAHELAHIRRYDYFVNLLQSIVETALFYHPAVWWISQRIRAERENCCDDMVVELFDNRLLYARALTELESLRRVSAQAAVAANGGSLRDRVLRLINPKEPVCSQRGSASAAVIAFATLMLLFPLSLVGREIASHVPTIRTLATLTSVNTAGSVIDVFAEAVEEIEHADAIVAAPSHPEPPSVVEADASDTPEVPDLPEPAGIAPLPPLPPDSDRHHEIDVAIARRIFGVTDDYRAAIARAGYDLSEKQLLEFRIHNVTPQFIERMNAAGLGRLTAKQLVGFRIHHVTPEFIRSMNAAFDRKLGAKELLQLRIHRVDEEKIASARKLFGDISFDEILKLSIHGISPGFIDALRTRGYPVGDVREATRLGIHRVTPEFIDSLDALGYRRLPIDDLLKLRIFNIDADFIRHLEAAGMKQLTVDQLVRLKLADVEAEVTSRRH